MKRSEHTFQFKAVDVADAAALMTMYHKRRIEYWQKEYEVSIKRVRDTASVKIEEFPVTGGKRVDVVVNHGDPTAYRRMHESFDKIQGHQKSLAAYESDEFVYRTQGERVYELDPADVLHYRLDGSQPDETETP